MHGGPSSDPHDHTATPSGVCVSPDNNCFLHDNLSPAPVHLWPAAGAKSVSVLTNWIHIQVHTLLLHSCRPKGKYLYCDRLRRSSWGGSTTVMYRMR